MTFTVVAVRDDLTHLPIITHTDAKSADDAADSISSPFYDAEIVVVAVFAGAHEAL